MKDSELFPIGTVSLEQLSRYIDDLTSSYLTRNLIPDPPQICNTDMVKDVEQACLEEFNDLY